MSLSQQLASLMAVCSYSQEEIRQLEEETIGLSVDEAFINLNYLLSTAMAQNIKENSYQEVMDTLAVLCYATLQVSEKLKSENEEDYIPF